ncbi:fumarylacetoacetate hydrolase family protein [Streptomyces blattellae]|uniref:fumarylacetoacetate hydrolase family protein n=1 Tax=Streptomyces blattellae TaxID=2569855 RepID=UPI0012B6EEE8|nr:fumarylacetoacetate hydrolase family protein [Streptomyces blattellae]
MRLIAYAENGRRFVGAVSGDKVAPIAPLDEFYADVPAALASEAGTPTLLLTDLEQVPPVPLTSRVFCVGINYHSHAGESKDLAGLDVPKLPMIFGRWASTLVTDGTPVPVPPNEPGLDWEVELAAVVGTPAWNVTPETALDHIFGYTAFNDLSARRKQLATPQFTVGKNADRSGPIGPVVVTADELSPAALRVTTRVNGEIMQDGNTRDLIHDVAAIVSYLSDTITLLPGDVIATGTPGGIGAGRKPEVFLQPGDVVEVEVEGIGAVRNPIVDRSEIEAP